MPLLFTLVRAIYTVQGKKAIKQRHTHFKGGNQQKKIKVQYSSRSTQQMPNRALPKIQMEGKWLADLGFQVGDHLEVICEQGQILIRSLAIQE